MMAPKFERLRDLQEALSEAAYALDHPIDSIEVRERSIRVTAGPQSVDVRIVYGDMTGPDGLPMAGSPSRFCVIGPAQNNPGIFSRLKARFGL